MITDVKDIIRRDLVRIQSERRRHFAPAVLLTLIIAGGIPLVAPRPDLLDQPPWRIAAQLATWLLGLVLFPAIGLGMWFPRRTARVGLALAAIVSAFLAVSGPSPTWSDPATGSARCGPTVMGMGTLLVTLALASGAYLQRRNRCAVYWVAASIAMLALASITWTCRMEDLRHVLLVHVGAAFGVLTVAVAMGRIVRTAEK